MKNWSPAWKASRRPSKQRKYRAKAPYHIQGRALASHLSSELRQKHHGRNLRVRRGDTVKVLRGGYAGKQGKVARIEPRRERVFIEGIERLRRDGTKSLAPFHPSKLLIIELAPERRRLPAAATPAQPGVKKQ
jgi:large subunit ribosomal protein L24